MAVTLKANGVTLRNPDGFSVVEDSTPLDPSDTTGGVGQITATFGTLTGADRLMYQAIELSDSAQGKTTGIIRTLNATDAAVTVTADSRMTLLTAPRQVAPYSGTLAGLFEHYLAACGIVDGFVVDAEIADRPIVVPGWFGSVWDYLKKLAAAEQVEMQLVSNLIVLRGLRQRVAERKRLSSSGWSLDGSSLARAVEIYVYNSVYSESKIAYPVGGWNESVSILTVNAGETRDFDLDIEGASVSNIMQPVCVDWVDRYHDTSSVYSVTGNDGKPIPKEQWLAGGGNVLVTIGEDTRSLVVTVTGSVEAEYAPYSLSMAAGVSNDYSSLRIVGTGVFGQKELLTFGTGVDPLTVSQEVGATIDNEFIRTNQQAHEAVAWALKRWGSPKRMFNGAAKGINRAGESGGYSRPVFADFDAANPGASFADFDGVWAGQDFADFDDHWNATTADDFANQAFGNISGARVLEGGLHYRIRSATTTPSGISFNAEEDTIFGDFDDVWPGATFADFDAERSGQNFADFNTAPLTRGN